MTPRVATLLPVLALCALAACGGDAARLAPTPPVVTTVTIPQTAITIGSTGTAQVTAIARDAHGATLPNRLATWSSSNTSVATIEATTGFITALAQGSSIITATIEGKTASVLVTVLDVVSIPAFQRPFAGDFLMSNFMDHDVPFEFVDDNRRFTTFWGEVHANTGRMIDGHSGYDWTMPTGTPLLAVAPGTVISASTSNKPFFCPLLNREVTDMISVAVAHILPGGVSVISQYLHLSRLDVSLGQVVTAGTQLGLSGNTGCSSGPHLHFETYRAAAQSRTGHVTTIDPYGWAAPSVDPWDAHAEGAPSIYLWKAGEAPALRRGGTIKPAPTQLPVLITQFVFEGVRDDVNPNNEYVEVSLNPLFPSATLDGYQLRGDESGVSFSFPQGITLTPALPTIRVYTGIGTSSATTLYMARASGIWSNVVSGDCIRLVAPSGAQFRINLGNGCPTAQASDVMAELPTIRDFSP